MLPRRAAGWQMRLEPTWKVDIIVGQPLIRHWLKEPINRRNLTMTFSVRQEISVCSNLRSY